jgi:anion-transporting  ArsA/GET3 family ATPase
LVSRPTPEAVLAKALAERSVLVTCGSGGVGKTTSSAALGLRAAALGRRVLVCTIDPSRRLATSLGLSELSHEPQRLELGRIPAPKRAELWAMTLDTRRTFDALVERHAPTPESRRRILENRYYREVSGALAGSHEYMAMERLLELSADERFDLVVLDTPPTRHALDFLEAPDRMLGFLDTEVLRWFLKPYFAAGRLTLKVASRTGAALLGLADRALGLQFLQDLSEFFLAFEDLYGGFKERAARVHELLRDGGSGFLLVAGPSPPALEEAVWFHRRLAEKGMPFVGFVVNRVHPRPAPERRGRAPRLSGELSAKLVELYRDERRLARAEERAIARLEVDTGETALRVAERERDVHDLAGLWSFAEALVPAARRAGRGR